MDVRVEIIYVTKTETYEYIILLASHSSGAVTFFSDAVYTVKQIVNKLLSCEVAHITTK